MSKPCRAIRTRIVSPLVLGALLAGALVSPALAAAGDLDASFGAQGRVVTAVGDSLYSTANAVAIQPDGKIVAAGVADAAIDIAVARYLPDGSLDPTFGSGGIVTTNIGSGDGASGVAVAPDGRIVVVGQTFNSHGNTDFVAIRYLPDGALDPTFGDGGMFVKASSPSTTG